MNKRRFLLSRLVKGEIERLGGAQCLQDALGEESQRLMKLGFRLTGKNVEGAAKPGKIDRHKLVLIANEDEYEVLHLWELRVLTSYFERTQNLDFSQIPLFESTTIYEPLIQAGRASFLFGLRAESNERATSLRLWDFRSMTVIAEEIHRLAPQTELDWRLIDPEPVNDLSGELRDRSLISIGSPLANVATEVLLSKMFEIVPFRPRPIWLAESLPFQFIWPTKFQSAFAAPPAALGSLASDADRASLEQGLASAMLINGQAYVVKTSYSEATIPGIVAAQRMPGQRIVVVAAGLSGPATFGAANLLKDLTAELPPYSPHANQNPIMWAALTVHVVAGSNRPGDSRVLDRWAFIHPPGLWSRGRRLR